MCLKMAAHINKDDSIPKKRIRLSESNSDQNEEVTANHSNSTTDSNSPEHAVIPDRTDSRLANLPSCISSWKNQTVLQNLSITISYDENISPLELLERFLPTQQSPVLNHIEMLFNKYCYFNSILDGDFDSLSKEVANELRRGAVYSYQTFLDSVYMSKLPESEVLETKRWFERFEGCGSKFGKKLFNMTLKRDFQAHRAEANEAPLCDCDYQFLFDSFASIFGLQSDNWCEPFLWPSTLEISGETFTGKAAILYCRDIDDVTPSACGLEDLMHIVAVCDTEQTDSDEVQGASHVSQSTSADSCQLPPHISHRLLSQHGGKLLLYYLQSAIKKYNAIFGLIIQGTKVTFTALKITARQYKGIEKGQYENQNPELIVTRQYDFLKKEERSKLIRPLIELAMLQQVCY